MNKPKKCHWEAACGILRYIKNAPKLGLFYKKNNHTNIVGYSDADYASLKIDRRSTSSYCTFVGGNLMTWSKKKDVVARSNAKAEYRAMAHIACQLIWVHSLITEFGFQHNKPIPMYCDNQAAIFIANNPVFHKGQNISRLIVTSLEIKSQANMYSVYLF